MTDTTQLILEYSATFVGAVTFGWITGKRRALKHPYQPVPGATVRIHGKNAVYRCKLEKVDGRLWTLSPPLSRDQNLPMSPGEAIVGEVTIPGGTLTFRTQLDFADKFRGRLWLKAPKRTFYKELASL